MRGGCLKLAVADQVRRKKARKPPNTSIEVKSGPSSQNGSGCSLLKSERGLNGGVRRAGVCSMINRSTALLVVVMVLAVVDLGQKANFPRRIRRRVRRVSS